MAWDTNGVNNWTTSSLKNYLNGTYYSTIEENAKSIIQPVSWKIGGMSNSGPSRTPKNFYTAERSASATIWTDPGYVALPYASDFTFATSGETIERESCLITSTMGTDTGEYWSTRVPQAPCPANSWMFQQVLESKKDSWTLTPYAIAEHVFNANYESDGALGRSSTSSKNKYGIIPTLYLKSNVVCGNCDKANVGSESVPMKLIMCE